MKDEELKTTVLVIRKAFAGYPKNDSTVNKMIEQGLRSGFVRGLRESE